jgi:hypothetical protein
MTRALPQAIGSNTRAASRSLGPNGQKVNNSDNPVDQLNGKWVCTKLQNGAKCLTFAGSARTPSIYPITIFAKLLDVSVCSPMLY